MSEKAPKAPKADAPRCDLIGCGAIAIMSTDGTEEDVQGLKRPALPNLNVCSRHTNWPHSEDAKAFALSDIYRNRK
jgi:hypothetical protein